MKLRTHIALALLMTARCQRNTPTDSAVLAVARDACSAETLGLRGVRPVTTLRLPPGCTLRRVGDAPITSEAAFRAALSCPEGASVTVDFSREQLVGVEYLQSPAGAGLAAFDDGQTLTVVSRFTANCPDDPRPMPMPPVTWWLRVEGLAPRAMGAATCTVPRRCGS